MSEEVSPQHLSLQIPVGALRDVSEHLVQLIDGDCLSWNSVVHFFCFRLKFLSLLLLASSEKERGEKCDAFHFLGERQRSETEYRRSNHGER